MKKNSIICSFALLLCANLALASESVSTRLVKPAAGMDYPTDRPMPLVLRNKSVLVVDDYRVLVEKPVRLQRPTAGLDYPTDSPPPSWAENSKVLALGKYKRVPVVIEQAQAGIDFPTGGPANMDRDFLVWSFSRTFRLALKKLHSIEKAVAGVDYPTDGPSDLNRDFYVVVDTNGSRFALE